MDISGEGRMDAMVAAGKAEEWFGSVDLGDDRRNRRLRFSVERMMEHPGGTLPDKLRDPAALDAFYRLMNCEEVTAQAVHAPVFACTREKMLQHQGVVLIIHDTTELDYSGLHSIDDLGQIGNGNGRGLLAHNSLAVTPQRQVLGLAGQLLHRRRRVPKRETKAQSKKSKNRESRLWKNACERLALAPEGHCWVDVCDRGADVTEFLAFEQRAGRHYLVRSKHNRRVEVVQSNGEVLRTKLHDFVRIQTPCSTRRRTVSIPAHAGQAARKAELAVAWCSLTILPPRQARGDHDKTPLHVWVVRVWEPNPPAGSKPVEWMLLTNVPVINECDAWERVDWYSCRWIVEEYHKAIKTGCGVEKLQFTRRSSLEPAVAVLCVVALQLLELRDVSRCEATHSQPATDFVPLVWVLVLSSWRHKRPQPNWTVREFLFALARLGGHQNRRHDHPPGWLVLWRGWTNLQAMVAGATVYSRSAET
jgi:hypothetical protein